MEELTPKQLLQARDWIKDCCPWGDLQEDQVDDLSDDDVTAGIERHFKGGISEFKKTVPTEE
ncbi:MAG: peptide ABC transporter substrate-binding protein [Nostoc sp. ChiQUE02]|uniref:peptide ABC transporter substrate-binding protein n=1 Tax=Nostoc sp. ChiQUE02 TaxID=3075377 RepID=UPI002AD2368B|nr:peptide ABC transporter substrate-binding protein [Nostoc sp. ChiQUE02]MDZ8232910.1 peptide ABC transporter substrate-binding protein [Nostoc sp. ChiQUE02]